jgi:hypothetical protein
MESRLARADAGLPVLVHERQWRSVRDTAYELKPKDGAWTHHPDRFAEPDSRMVGFTLAASRNGAPLGGHNVQAHVRAPDNAQPREAPSMTLSSGWLVYFRNQFAQAPDVAERILKSVDEALSTATAELHTVRGQQMTDATTRLFAATFEAEGPDYWR